jgi:nucleoside-diphosphate-sugar epimerase
MAETILVTGSAGFIGFQPKTKIEAGLKKFISWYREYYKI